MKIQLKPTSSPAINLAIAVGILLLTLMVILWPLAVIWALNTLFATNVPFTFWTWLSSWILLIALQVARLSNK